jgi:hypothetical protein
MPKVAYNGELVFGPEVAAEFDEQKARDIKHVKLDTAEMREELGLAA